MVVWAEYDVEYDHTKTFLDDGYTQQYFYLTQDVETGQWTIIDNTSPNTGAAAPDAWNGTAADRASGPIAFKQKYRFADPERIFEPVFQVFLL